MLQRSRARVRFVLPRYHNAWFTKIFVLHPKSKLKNCGNCLAVQKCLKKYSDKIRQFTVKIIFIGQGLTTVVFFYLIFSEVGTYGFTSRSRLSSYLSSRSDLLDLPTFNQQQPCRTTTNTTLCTTCILLSST